MAGRRVSPSYPPPARCHLQFGPGIADWARIRVSTLAMRAIVSALFCGNRPFHVLLLLCFAATARSQDTGTGGSPVSSSGLRLLELSTYESWITVPAGDAGTSNYDSGLSAGGSASIGFSATAGRARYTFRYTGSYFWFQQSRATDIDHAIDLSGEYRLDARTVANFGATAMLLNTNELLFSSPHEPIPASQSTGAAEAITATSPGVAVAAAPALLFGQRSLQAHVRGVIQREETARFVWSFLMDGTRTQSLTGSTGTAPVTFPILPAITSVQSSIQGSYLATERTSVGLTIGDQEMASLDERSRASTLTTKLSRQFRPHLRAAFRGGLSYVSLRDSAAISLQTHGLEGLFGAEVDYQRNSGQLIFSADRSPIDPYGVGANSTLTTMATWTYRRPGSLMGLQISTGWQYLNSSVFGSLQLLQFTVGFTRKVGRETDAQLSYAFTTLESSAQGPFASGNLSAVRFTLAWRPTNLRIL